MFISHHITVTSDEIITHIDVFSVFKFPYRNFKKSLEPIIFIFAINKTSDVLA